MNKNPITIEQLNDMVETKRALCQVVRGNQGRSYYLGDFLGKGGFAKVYKCFQLDHNNCANGDKKVLAAKVVQKELLRKQNSREKMAMEINIHKSIRHENIVDFHSNFEDKKTGAVYVLLELCDARSLMELSKRRHKLSEPEVRFYMKQMLAGLRHLHDINIIHRDLKLSNVLLAKDNQIGLVCKLADFGLATKVSDGKDDNLKRKTMCGTPNYISPEILNKVGHGKPTDIWSTACMMYALLHGKPPFETDKLETTYNKIKRNEYNIPSSERRSAATSMIKNMLHPDPEKRLSCRMLCEHPFIVRGYCPPYMPESAMTVAPAFNEKQNESILYEPEAKNNYIPPATRKPPLASSTQAMSQPSENMAISPEPPARRDDADDYLNVTQHQSHEHLFKCMAKHTENILEQTRELQGWVYSRGDANAYNPQMVNDNVDMDEAEDPAKRPVYWISKWVDYSDKYGLGYFEISKKT